MLRLSASWINIAILALAAQIAALLLRGMIREKEENPAEAPADISH